MFVRVSVSFILPIYPASHVHVYQLAHTLTHPPISDLPIHPYPALLSLYLPPIQRFPPLPYPSHTYHIHPTLPIFTQPLPTCFSPALFPLSPVASLTHLPISHLTYSSLPTHTQPFPTCFSPGQPHLSLHTYLFSGSATLSFSSPHSQLFHTVPFLTPGHV